MNTRKPSRHSIWSVLRIVLLGNRIAVYKHRDFRALLERERALADRHNRLFSLLEFAHEAAPEEAFSELFDIFTKRLRKTDVAGWTGSERVGVILPDTAAAGAEVLMKRIRAELTDRYPKPVCTISAYPSDRTAGEPVGEAHAEPPVADPVRTILLGRPPMWKRILDVTGAGAALVLLSPLMLVIALLIKTVSRGPVFFRQERVGYRGHTFVCWKFRTMRVNADTGVHQRHFHDLMRSNVPMIKLDMKNDGRLIPFGRTLRASGMDELPQLFNVVRGEMSLVGPRPCIRYEYERYQRWQKNRCDTPPGLTGLWQVSGKNKTTFVEMMRMDLSYTDRKSLLLDLMMLVRTVPAVLAEVRTAVRSNRR
jgi:lipopolysaccharide/colanic/teichoic acid biosynthesis glycosyltransferase